MKEVYEEEFIKKYPDLSLENAVLVEEIKMDDGRTFRKYEEIITK